MLSISPSSMALKIEKKIRYAETYWRRGIKRGAMLAGESVIKRADTLLNTGIRTGRKYKQLPNISSAPGEMPRSQSGRLAKSLYVRSGNSSEFRIGATVPWAKKLSNGDPDNNLLPRKSPEQPWLLFVVDQEEGITRKYLLNGVLKGIC